MDINVGPNVPATGSALLGSAITNLTITGSFVIATPGIAQLAVGTVALSSDNAVALLPSNSVRMVAVGSVLQFYFNQTGTAVFRATLNLGTF